MSWKEMITCLAIALVWKGKREKVQEHHSAGINS
jgi:hypothetical protein